MQPRCAVGGCCNTRNIQEGIALHTIPFYGDDRPEAKKQRKRWFHFVKAKRDVRSESRLSSVICSKHFKPDDLARRLDIQEENGILLTPWVKRDEFGTTAFPPIHAVVVASEKQQSVSGAERV